MSLARTTRIVCDGCEKSERMVSSAFAELEDRTRAGRLSALSRARRGWTIIGYASSPTRQDYCPGCSAARAL